MDTKVPGAVQSLSLEPASSQALLEALQLVLATRPALTLVLVGGTPTRASGEAHRAVKACMDDVDQLLLACFRRSDKVVRCGEASCAVILLDADIDGALGAIDRFQRALGCWSPLPVVLQVGLAAAPKQADEGEALLALALKPRLRIWAATRAEKGELPIMDEQARHEPLMTLAVSKNKSSQEKTTKAPHLEHVLTPSSAALVSTETGQMLLDDPMSVPLAKMITQARALGVPYIAPPSWIPDKVRNLLPAEVMRQLHCLPIGRDRKALTVALADPTDQSIVQHLQQLTGLTIFPVMTDPAALEALAQPVRSRRTSQVASLSARQLGN